MSTTLKLIESRSEFLSLIFLSSRDTALKLLAFESGRLYKQSIETNKVNWYRITTIASGYHILHYRLKRSCDMGLLDAKALGTIDSQRETFVSWMHLLLIATGRKTDRYEVKKKIDEIINSPAFAKRIAGYKWSPMPNHNSK